MGRDAAAACRMPAIWICAGEILRIGDPHLLQKADWSSGTFVPHRWQKMSCFSEITGGNLVPHLLQKTASSSGARVPHFGQN
jgi:hypothetical protein